MHIVTVTEVTTMPMSSPLLKLDAPSPCGCRIAGDDEAPGSMRIWYCRTHGAAFEVLDALQVATRALDRLTGNESVPASERALIQEVEETAKKTIRNAVDSYGYRAA